MNRVRPSDLRGLFPKGYHATKDQPVAALTAHCPSNTADPMTRDELERLEGLGLIYLCKECETLYHLAPGVPWSAIDKVVRR